MLNTLGVTGSSAIDPAIPILNSAVAWWKATSYSSGQTLTNHGTAGSALDMRLGSTSGADSNDPLFLNHDGTNYLWIGAGGWIRVWTPQKCTQYRATPLVGSPTTGAVTKGYSNHFNFTGVGSWKKFELLDADNNVLVTYNWTGPDASLLTPVETIGNNLLEIQSGYETGSSGFTTVGPINPASAHGRSTDRAYSGTYSYKVVAPGNTNYEGVYNSGFAYHLKPSTSYTFTGRVFNESSSTTSVAIAVRNMAYQNTASQTITTKGEWVPFSLTCVTNIENEGGGVVPGLELLAGTSAITGAATFYLDDLSVVETTPTPRPATLPFQGNSAVIDRPQFEFAGDDYFYSSDTSALDFGVGESFTVLGSCYYKPYYNWVIATKGSTNNGGFQVGMNYDGNGGPLRFRIEDTAGNVQAATMGATPTEDSRVVIGGYVNRSNNTARPILNGVVGGSGPDITGFGAIPVPLGVAIGATPVPNAFADFRWDNTAVWDYVLTPEEIAAVTEYWSR
jgi:Concanavalin A-like lectin/glucanases superfamily